MNVVVAMIDGSDYGRWALNWVAKMPLVDPPRVTVVHVMDTTTLRAPFLPVPMVASGKAYVQEEMERLKVRSTQLISDVKQQLAALKLKATVTKAEGAVAPEILKHAPKHDGLLVVGSKGVDTLHQFMLGSVSTNLLSYATCPVLVVKQDAAPLRRIILATDGSVASAQALEFVLTKLQPNRSTGKKGRVPIHVSVIHVEPSSWNPELMGVGHRSVERSVRKLLEAGFMAEPVYQLGKPAKAIMQAASRQHAELIVMGAKGLGGIARILLGSVSTRVAEYAACSVLVAR
jgi:nucleotide-binding universal stress UspA family protein